MRRREFIALCNSVANQLACGTTIGTASYWFHQRLGSIAPTTLAASESDGGAGAITFTRVIVMPDGQKYIEGVTPKSLPVPEGDKDQ